MELDIFAALAQIQSQQEQELIDQQKPDRVMLEDGQWQIHDFVFWNLLYRLGDRLFRFMDCPVEHREEILEMIEHDTN